MLGKQNKEMTLLFRDKMLFKKNSAELKKLKTFNIKQIHIYSLNLPEIMSSRPSKSLRKSEFDDHRINKSIDCCHESDEKRQKEEKKDWKEDLNHLLLIK